MPGYLIDGKTVFFSHIPKCGGTSVERGLARLGREFFNDRRFFNEKTHPTICSAQHFHAAMIDRLFDPEMFDYRFAVVRHPVARLISEFRHRRDIRPRSRARSMAGVRGTEPEDFDAWVAFAFEGYRKSHYIFDNHIRPQSEFVTDRTEIFRLEDGMDSVFDRLSVVLGQKIAPPERPQQVSTKRDVLPLQETLDLIKSFYASDLEAFSYAD